MWFLENTYYAAMSQVNWGVLSGCGANWVVDCLSDTDKCLFSSTSCFLKDKRRNTEWIFVQHKLRLISTTKVLRKGERYKRNSVIYAATCNSRQSESTG
jgi:hypothetical protein